MKIHQHEYTKKNIFIYLFASNMNKNFLVQCPLSRFVNEIKQSSRIRSLYMIFMKLPKDIEFYFLFILSYSKTSVC